MRKRKGVSQKKNGMRETGDGYGHKGSTEGTLLSTTYHQGPTGMAGLGRGRQRASQREGQIKQRKLAETPKNNKETLGTHACTCARHARTIALHACGPIRHSHLIVSLKQRQSGLVYVRGCVEIGFCCFTHRSDGDCETLPATQNLSLTLACRLVVRMSGHRSVAC